MDDAAAGLTALQSYFKGNFFLGADILSQDEAGMETVLLDTIARIYDAGSCRQSWTALLEDISDLAGGEAASMLFMRPGALASVLSPRSDGSLNYRDFLGWAKTRQFFAPTFKAPVIRAVLPEDTRREGFCNAAFDHDVWESSGQGPERLRSSLLITSEIQIGFDLSPCHRTGVPTPRMRKVFKALLPHLTRSVKIQWRLQRLELERAISPCNRDAGVIVVNSAGRILMAAAMAEDILRRGAPLYSDRGVLSACGHGDTQALHRMIHSCLPRTSGYHLRGGSAEISYPESAPLNLSIMPPPFENDGFGLDVDTNTRPAALVYVEDIEARRFGQIERLKHDYDLTAAEAKIALACLHGGTREWLAAKHGISDSTVRTHLSRIYEKTGARRKTALIKVLLSEGYLA